MTLSKKLDEMVAVALGATPGEWRDVGGHIEVELPCVNGLPATFLVADVDVTDIWSGEMTDGAVDPAGTAQHIAQSRPAVFAALCRVAGAAEKAWGPDLLENGPVWKEMQTALGALSEALGVVESGTDSGDESEASPEPLSPEPSDEG